MRERDVYIDIDNACTDAHTVADVILHTVPDALKALKRADAELAHAHRPLSMCNQPILRAAVVTEDLPTHSVHVSEPV